jgi:hypothetical protein
MDGKEFKLAFTQGRNVFVQWTESKKT